jgi:hypothetical protein
MGRFRIAILGLTATLLVTPVSAFEFPTLRQPAWHELSSQQREILAPLGSEWDRMDDARRKKWMGIAARYPHLTPEEQTRVQNQMGGWSKLSPQQKQAVREKYKALRTSAKTCANSGSATSNCRLKKSNASKKKLRNAKKSKSAWRGKSHAKQHQSCRPRY